MFKTNKILKYIYIIYNENQICNSSRERSSDHASLRYYDIQLTPAILINTLFLKGELFRVDNKTV